jgi:hypothetical protein
VKAADCSVMPPSEDSGKSKRMLRNGFRMGMTGLVRVWNGNGLGMEWFVSALLMGQVRIGSSLDWVGSGLRGVWIGMIVGYANGLDWFGSRLV